jgi:transposase
MTMTTASLNGRAHTGSVHDDDTDPAAKPTRRGFSADYKADILAEYDSHPKGSDERGAILRREGLYSSHISEWRKQADTGARDGLAAKSK